jgi:hypothetical protein
MATTRYSLGPSQAAYLTATSVGAATVTTPIEVTVNWPALIASGLSSTQARMQVLNTLGLIENFIENGNKAALPG